MLISLPVSLNVLFFPLMDAYFKISGGAQFSFKENLLVDNLKGIKTQRTTKSALKPQGTNGVEMQCIPSPLPPLIPRHPFAERNLTTHNQELPIKNAELESVDEKL
jgi:hypothetical protein